MGWATGLRYQVMKLLHNSNKINKLNTSLDKEHPSAHTKLLALEKVLSREMKLNETANILQAS